MVTLLMVTVKLCQLRARQLPDLLLHKARDISSFATQNSNLMVYEHSTLMKQGWTSFLPEHSTFCKKPSPDNPDKWTNCYWSHFFWSILELLVRCRLSVEKTVILNYAKMPSCLLSMPFCYKNDYFLICIRELLLLKI